MAKNGRKQKLVFMDQARRMGWKGKSYKNAKKFERKLIRQTKNGL